MIILFGKIPNRIPNRHQGNAYRVHRPFPNRLIVPLSVIFLRIYEVSSRLVPNSSRHSALVIEPCCWIWVMIFFHFPQEAIRHFHPLTPSNRIWSNGRHLSVPQDRPEPGPADPVRRSSYPHGSSGDNPGCRCDDSV